MPARIVTHVHRPKRPPRKRKATALAVPVIVTKAIRRKPAETPPVADEPAPTPPPASDDTRTAPVPPAAKSAVVTTTSRKRAKLLRTAEPLLDDPEAADAMRAWLERAKWGHGPAG